MITAAFTTFRGGVRALAPKVAVVLGSGLSEVQAAFREQASVPFGEVPGFVPTSVHGHQGRMMVGRWADIPALLVLGRLHFYEGHTPEVLTGTIRVAADMGVKRVILTNAAGGIHPTLNPGSLMAIRGHFKLLTRDDWRHLAIGAGLATPYAPHLLATLSELHQGIYAALTGPSYETPAEIRALAVCGADAVGMSTALEAEAAAKLGLEVAAISCITNKAAGLGTTALDHAEVLVNAKLAVQQLAQCIGRLISLPV